MIGIIHEVYFDKSIMTHYIHNYFVGVSVVVVEKKLIKIRFNNGGYVEISLKITDDNISYRAEVRRKFTSIDFDCVYEQHGLDKFDELLKDIKWFLS